MTTRLTYLRSKIVDSKRASQFIAGWRLSETKVVFTNGCFDILHEGHVSYLAEAAEMGKHLVIGLNSDASVRRQGKGDDRPVNNEASRAVVLAALGFVDLVVLFDEDTPEELIKLIAPDILVKGGDYDPCETNKSAKTFIVGSDFVLSRGGEVKTVPIFEGFSTTNIINKLKG